MLASSNKKTYIGIATGVIMLAGIIILANNNAPASNTSLPSFLTEDPGGTKSEQATSSYTHPDGSFSFAYPDGATVKHIPAEDGEMVVVEMTDGSGIQIAITSFDEQGALTSERIRQDIPDITMNDTQTIKVDGAQAVAFTSTDASFGASAEVWFVRAWKLYQISTPDNSRAMLYNLLITWRWK